MAREQPQHTLLPLPTPPVLVPVEVPSTVSVAPLVEAAVNFYWEAVRPGWEAAWQQTVMGMFYGRIKGKVSAARRKHNVRGSIRQRAVYKTLMRKYSELRGSEASRMAEMVARRKEWLEDISGDFEKDICNFFVEALQLRLLRWPERDRFSFVSNIFCH